MANKLGEYSKRLRISVEMCVYWLDNHIPPWTAYRVFMFGRLIVLDKRPVVHPVSIGEIWWCLFYDCVLRFTENKFTNVCQNNSICVSLKAGFNGAMHGVHAIWDANLSTEDWGLLLVDVNNEFNEINQIRLLWKVCHLWPFGAHLVFNRYSHWPSIVLHNRNGTDSFLYSKEVVMQGDSLSMVAYGITVIPLIKLIKAAYTDITQP